LAATVPEEPAELKPMVPCATNCKIQVYSKDGYVRKKKQNGETSVGALLYPQLSFFNGPPWSLEKENL